MEIVYALTHNYYHKLYPSVRSLLEHNPDAHVFVLAEDDRIDGLPDNFTIINVSGQQYFPKWGVNYNNQFRYINLLKVCYPYYIPADRVIHLDVDTIICDNLEPIWNLDMTDKWVAAVPEYHGHYKPFGDLYFNAGVMVINLAQMRTDNIMPDMITYLNEVKQPWADQDAWDKYGLEQGKFMPLPVRYNENIMCGETDDPAIVHYCSISDWYERKNLHRREYLERYIAPLSK